MTTASEHCATLLSAIIPNRRDLLDQALRRITADHFPDPLQRALFGLLERYADRTGAVLTRVALEDLIRHRGKADEGKVQLFLEIYDSFAAATVDDADFSWSLDQVRELAADRATGETLTQAMEILTRGSEDERGEVRKGHADARAHVLQRFAEIDRDLTMQESPEGDMRGEGPDILADYAARKAARENKRNVGVKFGVEALDRHIGGLQNGELILAAGYTSDGKTTLAVQLAWSAAVEQGKNVVFLTTETVRNQVRRRTIARHSMLDGFGITDGLNSRDIRNGTLTAEQERQLQDVVHDFDTNPGYGHFYIVQVPHRATVSYCASKITRLDRLFPVDLVIMDYPALLKAERRRQTDREELSSILKDCKQLAVTARDGQGVPFFAPWQVSRSAREQAERTGSYGTSALSETAEAGNSADLVIGLLAPLDNEERIALIKAQLMKYRDGQRANSIEIEVDYATCCFRSPRQRSDGMNELFAEPMGLGL